MTKRLKLDFVTNCLLTETVTRTKANYNYVFSEYITAHVISFENQEGTNSDEHDTLVPL